MSPGEWVTAFVGGRIPVIVTSVKVKVSTQFGGFTMNRLRYSIVLIAISLTAVHASATPSWQTDPLGQAPTTYQKWTFDDDDNPAIPEIYQNVYGTPLVTITDEPDTSLPLDWYEQYQGREGVWLAGISQFEIEVPNRPVEEGYKEIWFEAIYRVWIVSLEVTTSSPDAEISLLHHTVTDLGDSWYKLEAAWRVEPNPVSETITLKLAGSGGALDEMTVQTICVPEPATLMSLGLGFTFLVRRRRNA